MGGEFSGMSSSSWYVPKNVQNQAVKEFCVGPL